MILDDICKNISLIYLLCFIFFVPYVSHLFDDISSNVFLIVTSVTLHVISALTEFESQTYFLASFLVNFGVKLLVC